jgi:hypothetical protein
MGDWRVAVYYRNRAEMLRTIAEVTEHADHQRSLRGVADYYEKLADSLEDTARSQDQ